MRIRSHDPDDRGAAGARRGGPWAAVAACVVLLASACTQSPDPPPPDPDPEPVEDPAPAAPIGAEMAVVLPPRTFTSQRSLFAIESDLRSLQRANAMELSGVRPLVPESPVFVGDLAAFASDGPADLTCILSEGGAEMVSELQALRPAERFCAVVATESDVDAPEAVDLLVVRTEELGHVLGASAATLSPEGVALALGPGELGRSRFVEGVLAGLGGTPPVSVDRDLEPDAAMAEVADSGAGAVVVGTGPDSADLLAAADHAGLVVVGPRELSAAGHGGALALTWEIDWHRVLQPSVDRLVGRSSPAPRSMGFAQDVFRVRVGDAGSGAFEQFVDDLVDQIVTGDRSGRESTIPLVPDDPQDGEDEPDEPDGPAEQREAATAVPAPGRSAYPAGNVVAPTGSRSG